MDSTLTIQSGTGFLEPVRFREAKIETTHKNKKPHLVNACYMFASEAAFTYGVSGTQYQLFIHPLLLIRFFPDLLCFLLKAGDRNLPSTV